MTDTAWHVQQADSAVARDHGLRTTYKAGCRCSYCRSANAAYSRTLRLLHAKGTPPLGVKIPAQMAKQQLRALLTEEFTRASLAARAGLHRDRLYFYDDRITLRTALRLQRVYRQVMDAEPNQPNGPT